jgi:hypothetical protein
MNLPDALTAIAYVCLAGLGVWLLAHAISIIGSAFRPPWRRWAAESDALADELRGLAERTKGLVWDITHAAPSEDETSRVSYMRQRFASLRSMGPERGLGEWLSRLEPGLDGSLRAALEEADRDGWASPATSAKDALDADHSRWQGRLGLLIAAGPPAGAAPTMSGAMSFLAAYADKAREGVTAPPMAAIRDALLTTYLGCAICVIGIVLLAIVSGLYRRGRPELVRAVEKVRRHYETWVEVTQEAASVIDEEEGKTHA